MINYKNNICYLLAERSLWKKQSPRFISETWGLRPQAVFKTNVSVFVNTDRSSPANNVYIWYGFETNLCVES